MACRGWFCSLDESEATDLLRARDAAEFLNDLYGRINGDRIVPVDKSWDAMHRCLCGGWLDDVHGESALRSFVLGGQQLVTQSDYIVSFVPASQVPSIANRASTVTKDWFMRVYFDLSRIPHRPQGIFGFFRPAPRRYEGPIGETDFEYTWSYFEEVREFYARAAASGYATAFCVDQ
jgi:hypothetical protein